MIKKTIIILLSILLMSFLFGCSGKTEEFQQPVSFYYPEKAQDDGSINNVIRSERREGAPFGNDLQLLLTAYLAGPMDPTLYSPFPARTELIESSLSDDKVVLHFSEAFGELSSLERTIACACISKTCMEFTGTVSVEIFAEGILFDGVDSIVITQDNLLTEDNTPITET